MALNGFGDVRTYTKRWHDYWRHRGTRLYRMHADDIADIRSIWNTILSSITNEIFNTKFTVTSFEVRSLIRVLSLFVFFFFC